MKRPQVFWLVIAVLALAALGLTLPASPIYLPRLLDRGPQYQGRPLSDWLRELHGDDDAAVQKAAFAVGVIGAEARAAVPRLARLMLDHPSREIRNEAALALSKMDPASEDAVAELARALKDPEPAVRMNATRALFRLRAAARPAVPALIESLNDVENHTNLDTFTHTVRELMARALGRASAGTAEGVPALTAFLEAADSAELRIAAAHALGEVGAEARPAAPGLRNLLRDANSSVREAAAEALELIGADPAGDPKAAEPKAAGDGPEAPPMELPEAERAYLWEIEHHGNILVKHGFAPLAAALKQSDPAALARLLADDFTGAELREPRRIRASAGLLEVERLQPSAHGSTPIGRDAFIARLMEWRRLFAAAPPNVKFSLMNLGPKVRKQLEGDWEGTALLRLYGDYSPGAPAEAAVILRYELPRPTIEALAQPGWLRGAAVLHVLTAKAPTYLFTEVAQQRGLDIGKVHDNWNAAKFHPATGGAFVCDFNRDGVLDLLITDIQSTTLYQGQFSGRFTDVTSRCGLAKAPPTTLAAWVDIDGDGWEDLILSGQVFRNDEGKRFVDVGKRCNLRLPAGAGNIIVGDYDKDGKLDLYVTRTGTPGSRSWLDDKSSDPRGNYLFRNKGDWQFEDVTRASGAFGGRRSTFTAAWLDANNDGWPDLHVPNEFGDGALLVNNRDGTFTERSLADRPADYGTMGMTVGDVNNDGNIDVYCNNMFSKAGTRVIHNLADDAFPGRVLEKMRRFVAGSQLHMNKGGLTFEQVGTANQVAGVGWAYGACLADLDNDGWLDIYATAGFISKSRDLPDG